MNVWSDQIHRFKIAEDEECGHEIEREAMESLEVFCVHQENEIERLSRFCRALRDEIIKLGGFEDGK